MEAAGLGVGIVSLAFELFENSVRCFRFLSFMVDMPKNCENCRLRLIMEYNRLLAWGDTVGLIEVADDSSIAASLGTNSAEFLGLIHQIVSLLENFNVLGQRWKELSPLQDTISLPQKTEADALDQLHSVLRMDGAYIQSVEKRKGRKSTNHILRWMGKTAHGAKEIVSNPRRVRWVAVDRHVFEMLLKDLHIITERLHELLNDVNLKKIAEITSETYRELILARSDVQDLRELMSAVASFLQTSTAPNDYMEQEFGRLLQLKNINRTADCILEKIETGCTDMSEDWADWASMIHVPKYDGASLDEHFAYAHTNESGGQSFFSRARGTLKSGNEESQAWIEWRRNETAAVETERVRVAALAQMLHALKPTSLLAPTCLGYIDDADRRQFGWIFAMPSSNPNSTLKTLHSILGNSRYKPSKSQRMLLAYKLATSLLYLHTCDWLHKGIHSGNILFSFEGDEYTPEEPIVCGFDYSRSENSRTISGSLEPQWDMYRWPRIQNHSPKAATSRKTYDIYSLGLVLLEIAYWKPLVQVLGLDKFPQDDCYNQFVREWLLGGDDPPFDVNPLLSLPDVVGDRYRKAISRCIQAHGPDGLEVEEQADQVWSASTGIKIQSNFNRFVVQELKTIAILHESLNGI